MDPRVLDACSLEDVGFLSLSHTYAPLETLLESVSRQAQRHILAVYTEKYHLFATLRMLHQLYLLGAGDFYLEFISRVDHGFLHTPGEVSDGWMKEQFDRCVNTTSLVALTDTIAAHVRLRPVRALSVLDIWRTPFFTVECEPNLRVVFSDAALGKYEQVFAALMALRTQALALQRLWRQQGDVGQELERLSDRTVAETLRPAMERLNLVRMKMQGFLTTLQNFFFLHIINKLYDNLTAELEKAEKFEIILQLHEEFINELCRCLFVLNGDGEIKQILNELLDCSKRFVGVQVGFFVRWDEEPILRCSESPP